MAGICPFLDFLISELFQSHKQFGAKLTMLSVTLANGDAQSAQAFPFVLPILQGFPHPHSSLRQGSKVGSRLGTNFDTRRLAKASMLSSRLEKMWPDLLPKNGAFCSQREVPLGRRHLGLLGSPFMCTGVRHKQ